VRYANQLPGQVEGLIVALKRDKPHWGARKIPELLVRKLAGDVRLPAKSTVHAVLDRHGLVKRARMRRNRANGTPLSAGANPNDLWCTDFKGEFKLGNGRYCYPLTVSDHAALRT
jgi:transposase InsO family protein